MLHVADVARGPTDTRRAIQDVLDAVPIPAWMHSAREGVVYMNRTARASGAAPPSLRDVSRVGAGCATVPIDADLTVLLRVSRCRSVDGTTLAGLPRRMVQLATLLAQGVGEKEAASTMGLTLTSARTYVHRLYRRLGVHNRMELAARLFDAAE